MATKAYSPDHDGLIGYNSSELRAFASANFVLADECIKAHRYLQRAARIDAERAATDPGTHLFRDAEHACVMQRQASAAMRHAERYAERARWFGRRARKERDRERSR